jgi:hypothetical protein
MSALGLLYPRKRTYGGIDRGSTVGLFSATADRCDGGIASNAKRREMRADGVGNVGRRNVCVVFLRHAIDPGRLIEDARLVA